jgi:hypothetical protein
MTQAGFWHDIREDNRRVMLGDHDYGINRVFYLFPQGNGPSGSHTFTTFADLSPHLQDRDLVLLAGVLREQVTFPNVRDVTILGAANRPRQATDAGVPTGGGASWLPPLTPTAATPLITLESQGWTFDNVQFNPPAQVNSPAILLHRTALIESGQLNVRNCLFLGGGANQVGIADEGSGFVVVEDSEFIWLASGILGISALQGFSGWWTVRNCFFQNNTNDIKMSLHRSLIRSNYFLTAGAGAVNKVIDMMFLGDAGVGNMVVDNYFANTEATIQISNGFRGSAADVQWRNYSNNVAAMTVVTPPGA